MPPTEEDLAWFRSTFHPIPKPALPDDCVEYSLYIISSSIDASNDSELRLRLRDVQKYATEIQRVWLKDYIWQREGLALELQKEDGEVGKPIRWTAKSVLTAETGVSFIRGRTEYGDSVEDEWVIVWLLRELSKKFSDLWIKVTDGDGEFLLIEASGTLPAWLEPDVAENRVWINDGQLKIIKPANTARSSKRTDEKLTLQDARQAILTDRKRLMHSTSMEEEAFYRLRNYPAQIKDNMHHALVTIPRKVAFLLTQKPAYIAPAIEKFYLRDPIALKPLQSKANVNTMIFPPKDLVTISVCFPRVAYAQVKSQDFPPPAVFQNAMPSKTETKLYARAETGMKTACGFEMLLSDSQDQDKSCVREMKMLLDDLDSGDETLPTDEEIQKWEKHEDDEKWLDISFDDLEKELDGRKGKVGSGKKSEFGDKAAQENLQRIVKQFEDFLNDDKAGPDGAGMFNEDSDDDIDDDDDDDLNESDDDIGEDREASFDEDEFTKMMQEMMGMPSEVMKEIMNGKLDPGAAKSADDPGAPKGSLSDRVQELGSSSSDEGGEDMKTFMKQMEAELRESGALSFDHPKDKISGLQNSVKGKEPEGRHSDLSSDEESDDDIDAHLARNLLESFKSQAGMAGPGGNLMGLMGLGMPRDEADDGTHSTDAASGPGSGPSQSKRT